MEIIQQKNNNLSEKLRRTIMMPNGNCGPGACGNLCGK